MYDLASFVRLDKCQQELFELSLIYEPTAGYNPSTDDLESNIFAAAYQQLLRVLSNTAVR